MSELVVFICNLSDAVSFAFNLISTIGLNMVKVKPILLTNAKTAADLNGSILN